MTEEEQIYQYLKSAFPDAGSASRNSYQILCAVGNEREAILYASLFLPKFTEIDGSVLLCWGHEKNEHESSFRNAVTKWGRDEAEASFNFVEVSYIFDLADGTEGDEESEILAVLLRNSWRGWLKVKFPDREFKVEIIPPDITGSVVGIHFFERRC